jgi:hypothetical protein
VTPGAAFFFYNNAQHPHVESTLSARKVCCETHPGLSKGIAPPGVAASLTLPLNCRTPWQRSTLLQQGRARTTRRAWGGSSRVSTVSTRRVSAPLALSSLGSWRAHANTVFVCKLVSGYNRAQRQFSRVSEALSCT